jgi:hypothetical protein
MTATVSRFDEYLFDKDDDMSKKKGHSHGYGLNDFGLGKCALSHPALVIGDHKIWGGSCVAPAITDCDVYIGFDRGMGLTAKRFPWTSGHEFLFPIPDMGVPATVPTFRALVKWTAQQLEEGLKVHCGCIGGHGRTGTFLAALVKEMTGNEDAIEYVREHYCKKAVESNEQIAFLVKNFGIKSTKANKVWSHSPAKSAIKWPAQTGSSKAAAVNANSNTFFPMKTGYTLFTAGKT